MRGCRRSIFKNGILKALRESSKLVATNSRPLRLPDSTSVSTVVPAKKVTGITLADATRYEQTVQRRRLHLFRAVHSVMPFLKPVA